MIPFLLLLLGVATLIVLAVNPKIGSVLVWVVVFLYPHLYMERLGLLPWNIGVDDLFICAFFLIVVIRRNILGGVPLRMGISVLGVTTYFVIWTIAHLSGWSMMPELLPIDVVKPILKCVVFVLFTYAMVHTIDDQRDLQRSGWVFVTCLTLAGATVILHQLFPQQMVIFASERIARYQSWYGTVERAVGSLLSANTGCAILGMAVLFAISMIRNQATLLRKTLLLLSIPVLLVSMLLTESRTGALALGVSLVVMAVVSRSRFYAWAIGTCVVVLAVLKPGLFVDFWHRLSAIYDPEFGGRFDPSAQRRIDVWKAYWDMATPQVWLFGQGRLVPTIKAGTHSHSSYLGALFIHGIAGVIWLVLFFGIIVRRGLWLVRRGIEPYRTTASAVLWGLLAWGVAGLTLDMVVTPLSRYVYLFYAVLIERAFALSKQAAVTTNAQFTEQLSPRTGSRLATS